KVTGLRIDHPDGLLDPTGYLRQLQVSYLESRLRARLGPDGEGEDIPAVISAWYGEGGRRSGGGAAGPLPRPRRVVTEKILSRGESLPDDWAVDGATGYEFAAAVNSLFVDSANRKTFDSIYGKFTRTKTDLRDAVISAKKMTMLVALASEINMLSH